MTQPQATARHVAKLKACGSVRITLMLPPDCVSILARGPAGLSRTGFIVQALRATDRQVSGPPPSECAQIPTFLHAAIG